VPSEVANVAVELASGRAGPERFDALRAALSKATTPHERSLALRAMGYLRGDALGRALDFTLESNVHLSEVDAIVLAALRDRDARPTVIAWMKAKWDAIRAKRRGRLVVRLARALDGACTAEERDDLSSFLSAKLSGMEGASRALDVSTERAGQCIALRTADAGAVTMYFKH
jgi:hypothetical protein